MNKEWVSSKMEKRLLTIKSMLLGAFGGILIFSIVSAITYWVDVSKISYLFIPGYCLLMPLAMLLIFFSPDTIPSTQLLRSLIVGLSIIPFSAIGSLFTSKRKHLALILYLLLIGLLVLLGTTMESLLKSAFNT